MGFEQKNKESIKIAMLRSALERTMMALERRNLGKPYRCLDEVFAEAESALKKTNEYELATEQYKSGFFHPNFRE